MKRELGKMFGTFILIQNLCHEDLPVLPWWGKKMMVNTFY
jgi:hypothetical protein